MDSSLQSIIAAIASFIVVTCLFAVTFMICKAASKRQRVLNQQRLPVRTTRAIRSRTVPDNNHPKKDPDLNSITIGESATFDPALSKVSIEELVRATANFSPELIVGDGSFGYVYKAKLSSGVMVAVKKLSADAFQGFREFRAEMETLGKIVHPNIVKILGYCATGSERILVYEYVAQGSLDQWLHDTSSSSEDDVGLSGVRFPLPWSTRIKIIQGIARGLAFMHSLETPIIHRDIKASNVLLDENFVAHIADFGLARRMEGSHSHVSTQVAGTMGYIPPEYLSGATMATMMGDVYSFGVLMLEIITGKRPNFPFKGEDGKEIRLVQWVHSMVVKEQYVEMVDANILKSELKQNEVMEVVTIATMCATENGKIRPSMEEVVQELDGIPTT
ncbi:OLC1v1017649C1 [Oldenlandia corymbosa var. corymbosa]|uniref:OLC1v1017649C1 n=1 Tax=Oldenlandia corymbosa var. corymbosa TaxID=529605 RepID=A0AAV1E9V6_OLDCO|nr:OLC1v1017649C1 [Oldenlandia corymbosa var. corymbosa]